MTSPKINAPTSYFSHVPFHEVQRAPICWTWSWPKTPFLGESRRRVLSSRGLPQTQTPDHLHTQDSKGRKRVKILSDSSFLLQRKSPHTTARTEAGPPNQNQVQRCTRKEAAGPFPSYLAKETARAEKVSGRPNRGPDLGSHQWQSPGNR